MGRGQRGHAPDIAALLEALRRPVVRDGPYLQYWRRVAQRVEDGNWLALQDLPSGDADALLAALGIVPWRHSPERLWLDRRGSTGAQEAPGAEPVADEDAADRWAMERERRRCRGA